MAFMIMHVQQKPDFSFHTLIKKNSHVCSWKHRKGLSVFVKPRRLLEAVSDQVYLTSEPQWHRIPHNGLSLIYKVTKMMPVKADPVS